MIFRRNCATVFVFIRTRLLLLLLVCLGYWYLTTFKGFVRDDRELSVSDYHRDYLSRNYGQNASSITFVLRAYEGGLGVNFFDISLFRIASETRNIPFHIMTDPTFHYHYFFQLTTDFSVNSTCPIVMNYADSEQRKKYPQLPWNVDVNSAIRSLKELGQRHLFVLLPTPAKGHVWWFLLNQYNYRRSHSLTKLFRKMQLYTRSLWNLNGIMNRQTELLRALMFRPNETFLVVQIRGGVDKIGGEMDFLPVCEYVKRVVSLRYKYPHNQLISVFVLSNDLDLVKEFQRQLAFQQGLWRVITWGDGMRLLEQFQLSTGKRMIPEGLEFAKIFATHEKVHSLVFEKKSTEENSYHTHEIVSTLSLVRDSSYLICSMNSNYCKFLALLRSDGLKSHVNMDYQKWSESWRPKLGFVSQCQDQTAFKSWCDPTRNNITTYVNCATMSRKKVSSFA